MRRLLFLLAIGLLTVAVLGIGCGKKPEIQEEVPVDTTPVVEPEPEPEPEPPPPPPPQLRDEQLLTIYFETDKYNLLADAKAGLDHNFDLLKEFPDVIVKIEGHCDERNTVEYNLSLGENRAKAAQNYLSGLGIEPNRISIISYGEERPVDPGHTEDAWSKNRRCEFRIISQ